MKPARPSRVLPSPLAFLLPWRHRSGPLSSLRTGRQGTRGNHLPGLPPRTGEAGTTEVTRVRSAVVEADFTPATIPRDELVAAIRDELVKIANETLISAGFTGLKTQAKL